MGTFRYVANEFESMFFLIIQDLRSKFTTQRVAKVFSFTLNIRGPFNGLRAANADSSVGMRLKEQNQSPQDYELHSNDFSKPVGKSRSRKYPQGFFFLFYCSQH